MATTKNKFRKKINLRDWKSTAGCKRWEVALGEGVGGASGKIVFAN